MIDIDVLIKNLQKFKEIHCIFSQKTRKPSKKCAILAPKTRKGYYDQFTDKYLFYI